MLPLRLSMLMIFIHTLTLGEINSRRRVRLRLGGFPLPSTQTLQVHCFSYATATETVDQELVVVGNLAFEGVNS